MFELELSGDKMNPMRLTLLLSVILSLCCLTMSGCGGSLSNLFSSTSTPVISGVTPASAAPGGTITIIGTSLAGTSTTAYFTLVTTGQTLATSTASSGNLISVGVVVPTTLPPGTYNLYVETSSSTGTSSPSNTVSIVIT